MLPFPLLFLFFVTFPTQGLNLTSIAKDITSHKLVIYANKAESTTLDDFINTRLPAAKNFVKYIDYFPNMEETKASLNVFSGRSSLPQVYLKGQYAGGFDELNAMTKKGTIQEMLRKEAYGNI